MKLFNVFGQMVIDFQKLFKAKTEEEAYVEANTKLNPYYIKKITVLIEDMNGNVEQLDIDDVTELSCYAVEEHIPNPFELVEETA
jgi:hypothetical protein